MTKLLFKLAEVYQSTSKDEAEAIEFYTPVLKLILDVISETDDEETKDMLEAHYEQIQEFIEDELHHLKTLQEMFSELTEIQPAKD